MSLLWSSQLNDLWSWQQIIGSEDLRTAIVV